MAHSPSSPHPGSDTTGGEHNPPVVPPVRLLLHGSEDRTLGGPSVRVPRTATALRDIGVPAQAALYRRPSDIPEDNVHLFNVWPPTSALQALRQLKAAGKRVVFSPIYLDFSERPTWSLGASEQERSAMRRHLQGRGRQHEIVPGYHAMVREMLALADHVVFLSEAERAVLEQIGAEVPDARASLVHNPVDATLWQGGDPAPFREAYLQGAESTDYVICVGRIEPRKNQLALVRALRGLPLRPALVGHEGDPAYAAQIRQEAGTNLIRPGRLAPGGETLRSALAGARAFVLPSWAEGASLAALEAAAAGVPLILSDRSSEREYFGDLARYCDPGDPESLRSALRDTLADADAASRAEALQRRVAQELSWPSHARATAQAYAKAEEMPVKPLQRPHWPLRQADHWAVDLTALTRPDLPREVQRSTEALARALHAQNTPPKAIFWCPVRRCFLDLPDSFLSPADAQRYAARTAADHSLPPVSLAPGTALLVAGGAWGCDEAHLRGLEALKGLSGGALIALTADAGPCLRPDLFGAENAEGYAARLHRLATLADQLVTPSPAARAELIQALQSAPEPPRAEAISALPLPTLPVPEGAPDPALTARFSEERFALVPGAVGTRGNLDLLIRIWARFAAEGWHPDLHLVIAGGIAPDGEDLAGRIARDPRLDGRVHLLEAEGADLAWLLRNTLITLCPSQSEGWDWPVTESLAQGTPCLVAEIPTLADPELTGAARAGVEALDPDDLPAWQARLSAHADTPPARLTQTPQGTWAEPATALAALALSPQPVRLARNLRAGETAPAGFHAPPQALQFGAGWHPAEEGLRWAASDRAEVRVRADGLLRRAEEAAAPDHLLMHLHLHSTLPETRRARLRVSSGPACLFDSAITGASLPRDLMLRVPTSALDDEDCLPLTLEFPVLPAMPDATAETRPPPDQEPLQSAAARGIGLVSVCLLDPTLNNPLAAVAQSAHWSEGRHPQEVDFALEPHREVVAPGLQFSPGWGVGSLHPRFALFVPLLPGAGPQTLALTLRPVASPQAPSGARILWNGRQLAECTWTDSQPVELTLALHAADLQTGPAVLEIVPTALATPADLHLGHERGLAGLGVLDLALTPQDLSASAE
ncbi:glycosyltransferase [Salipiger sp. PrR002]|uniref:glycosyltransferase family 4 protein n=1 Tax=Salipiger sp. PrR002 TaxID=2706489 RepID=UPI0013BD1795|nr:glycosyltransferase [Salipiger sp. PrR002]NDW01317.1 glycosyltransferase [Salipiger sp. PrR002]NDW58894.1 glycosyltransferase [Salipiger sp. PrR004]